MERRHLFGFASSGHAAFGQREAAAADLAREPRGSVVNFPGNPRFQVAFKLVDTTEEMEQTLQEI
jgi:hypothetical protein